MKVRLTLFTEEDVDSNFKKILNAYLRIFTTVFLIKRYTLITTKKPG